MPDEETLMRVAELSRRTGVPVPTIKYYLREGLLHSGELTSPNQARYDESHVRRLTMVRALVEVGGLSISAAREVLVAVDEPDRPVFDVLGSVQQSLEQPHTEENTEAWQSARELVDDLIAGHEWYARADDPPGQRLVRAVATLHELGREDLADLFDVYAEACEQIAEAEMAYVDRRKDIDGVVEGVVIGTVLGDVIISAIRRMAHQDAAARLYGIPSAEPPLGAPASTTKCP